MYCNKCGAEINDDAVVCVHCGCSVQKNKVQTTNTSKNSIGWLLAFFFGLIGLIIGVCMYQEGTVERETFMDGWKKGFIVSLIISVVLGIIYGVAIASLL